MSATHPKDTLSKPARIVNALLLFGFAAAILIAIDPLTSFSAADPNYRGLNLYSFFTIQSNIIAMIVFIIGGCALLAHRRLGKWFGLLRGGAVLYMLVTALVYALLLQNAVEAHSALGFNWKNFILHQITPLFIVIEWLLWPSRDAISTKQSLVWLVFPIAWLIYTFIRASITGWYPYPFLDPALSGGFLGVAAYVIGITIGFFLLCLGAAWVSRTRRRSMVK